MSNGAHALTEAELAAVREVWEGIQAANLAADWAALEQLLTDDYVQLDPRVAGPIRGRTAWREWADSLDFQELEGGFTVEGLSGSGDVAYAVWGFDGRWQEGGEEMVAVGKGLAVFQRGTDGSWRMSRNAWSMDPQGIPQDYRPCSVPHVFHGSELEVDPEDELLTLVSLPVLDRRGALEIGTPQEIITGSWAESITGHEYDITPDGRRFLVLRIAGATDPDVSDEVVIVMNWFEELRDRLGEN